MSSPTETPSVRPRARSRSARPNKENSRNKSVSIPSNIIELTDSESDDEPNLVTNKLLLSKSKNRLVIPKPLAPSGSVENMPSSSNQRQSNNDGVPLFPPSDEENIPPPRKVPAIPFQDLVEEASIDELKVVEEHENQPMRLVPEPQQDTPSTLLAQVLELVPDVQPEYAADLIAQHSTARPGEVVEAVINALFEAPYPKVDRKGKRKSTDDEEEQHKRPRLNEPDYANLAREYRGGVHYPDLSIEQLMVDFPEIPKPHIRKIFYTNKSLYAPTHLHLLEEKQRGQPLSYVPKKTLYKPSKGKRPALEDAEFEKEREWLLEKRKQEEIKTDAHVAEQINEQEYEDSGDGIECGCCFSTYPFAKMIQCPDAHLFCCECMNSYAENLLSAHNININCMDQSGCKLPFPVSELRRFLSDKLLDLYERVKQRKEIEMAGLDNLEECPFCDYKCVIENPNERLFRCGNEEGCGAITCRQCKKMDHLPKSCKEMEEDRVLDGRHLIEEAMTRALMRNCPRCNKSFVKEDGCNKMTCPNCHTLSCYVCRKEVKGYDHFNPSPPGATGTSANSNKCPLWEPVETRHAAEVKAAAEKALGDYKRNNPDVNETDMKVDVPKSPPRARNIAPVAAHGYGLPGMPRQNPYANYPQPPVHLPQVNFNFGFGPHLFQPPHGMNVAPALQARAPRAAPRRRQ